MASVATILRDIFEDDDEDLEFDGFGPEDIESDIDLNDVLNELSTDDESENEDEPRPGTNVLPPLGRPNVDDPEWSRDFSPITVNAFVRETGPILPENFDVNSASPIDYFHIFFNENQFSAIARHTNNYARWRLETENRGDPKWPDTNSAEIKAFIGINVLMGIQYMPETDMYWSSDDYLGNIGVKNVMPCNRFQKLSQYFHVSDRENEPVRGHENYDKLYKVRETIDHVSKTFLDRYRHSCNISVDEAMVKYTGRLSFRQYMPAKPIKCGIKIWMRCDAETAYLSRFQIYLGKKEGGVEHGLGYNVVTSLCDDIHYHNHHVYFDNYFTGVKLLEDLHDHGIYACGTCRSNRSGFPKEFKKPGKMNRGEYKVLQKGESNLVATVWKDKKPVFNLSTLSDPEGEVRAARRVGANVLDLPQPLTVYSYNKYMGGVDRQDQLRMAYDVGRASKRWWRYIFWFLVNCAIVNSFIVYKMVSKRQTKRKRYRHLDFKNELVRDLIGGYTTRKRQSQQMDNPGIVLQENVGGHINSRLPGPKRRCRFHLTAHKQRKETVYGCVVCGVHLCKDGCHNQFHVQ
ncbi:piggyBac transposable element-derived protein 4-like [Pecten maximus]|uniref:piggyBac transposable element-derived protein 4-like n=1 Tax=Pecten maximus TaxID=6579 RepID=UPI0014584E62|nr:piggyBac transposable element-derived protein 4-like [Pecten maximus]XP_033731019.1 piggyBac transposable element-derived protein 4-like [Pecten maximus]